MVETAASMEQGLIHNYDKLLLAKLDDSILLFMQNVFLHNYIDITVIC